jgi:hypothetical protein
MKGIAATPSRMYSATFQIFAPLAEQVRARFEETRRKFTVYQWPARTWPTPEPKNRAAQGGAVGAATTGAAVDCVNPAQ